MFFYINLSNNCDNKYKFMHFSFIFFHYILLKLSMWQQYKSQTTGHRKKHWTMTVQVTFDQRWKIIIMQCCLKWYIFFILQYIRKHLRAIHLDIYSVASLFQLVQQNSYSYMWFSDGGREKLQLHHLRENSSTWCAACGSTSHQFSGQLQWIMTQRPSPSLIHTCSDIQIDIYFLFF